MLELMEKIIEAYRKSIELELEAEIAILDSMIPYGSNHPSLDNLEDISQ